MGAETQICLSATFEILFISAICKQSAVCGLQSAVVIHLFRCPTHEAHFLAVTVRIISQGLKCNSRIWKSVVVGLHKFWLVSADTREGGTSNEALRVWEAMYYGSLCILLPVISANQHNTNSKF